jgi:tripartite-type tricarboxylate transporter receptor subunit TctC
MMKRFVMLFVAAVSALVLFSAGNAPAAAWPEKGRVITMYIPWGAGGGSDMAGRMIAQFLEPELGVKVVVLNKPGGGSQVGTTEYLQKAGTDGYTILLASLPSSHAAYLDPDRKAMYGMKDIQLVANFGWSPAGLAVKKGKYKTLKELVDKAKANPGKVRITAGGPLSPADLAIILLEKSAGISVGHMFYDQQGEQRAALLGEHVDAESNPSFELVPGQKSGEIETLAIFDTTRSIYLPDVKTAEEQGFKDIVIGYGAGFSYKAGTHKAIVDKFASAVEKIGKIPEYQAKCEKLGLAPEILTGEKYAAVWKHSENIVKAVLDEMSQKKK